MSRRIRNKEQQDPRPRACLQSVDDLRMDHSVGYELPSVQTKAADNPTIQYEESVINRPILPNNNMHVQVEPNNEALDRDRNRYFDENEETRNYEILTEENVTSGSSADQSPYDVLTKPDLNEQIVNQSDYECLIEGQQHQGLNDYEELRRRNTDAASVFARRKIVTLIPPIYCETKTD